MNLSPNHSPSAATFLAGEPRREQSQLSIEPRRSTVAHQRRGRREPALPAAFYRVNPWIFAGKLTLLLILLGIGAAGVLLSPGLLQRVPFQVLLGVMFAHAVELQHQTLHGTAFRSTRANRRAGTVLGLPMLVPYTHYRVRHLLHHARVGTPRDTEFFHYDHGTLGSPLAVVRYLFSLHRFPSVIRSILEAVKEPVCADAAIRNPADAARIGREYRLMGVLIAGAVGASLLGSTLPAQLWLIPLLLVAEPVHRAIELPEHFGCDRQSPDVRKNTRSIRSNWFVFWLTNGNSHHAEHHLYMTVPTEKLPALHVHLASELQHLEPSYLAFFTKLITRSPQRSAAGSGPKEAIKWDA
jgi:fatty acid desaturase